jgi:hypothetical protein
VEQSGIDASPDNFTQRRKCLQEKPHDISKAFIVRQAVGGPCEEQVEAWRGGVGRELRLRDSWSSPAFASENAQNHIPLGIDREGVEQALESCLEQVILIVLGLCFASAGTGTCLRGS